MKHMLWLVAVAVLACSNDKSKDTPKAMETQTPAGAGTTASAGPSAPKTLDKESESPGNAAAVAVNKLDVCTLLTVEEATEIMGKPMKRRAAGGEENCGFEAEKAPPAMSIDITVNGNGPQTLAAQKSGAGATDVAGIGDGATYSGGGQAGRLTFAKGERGVMVTVMGPNGSDGRAIAEKAAAKMVPRLD